MMMVCAVFSLVSAFSHKQVIGERMRPIFERFQNTLMKVIQVVITFLIVRIIQEIDQILIKFLQIVVAMFLTAVIISQLDGSQKNKKIRIKVLISFVKACQISTFIFACVSYSVYPYIQYSELTKNEMTISKFRWLFKPSDPNRILFLVLSCSVFSHYHNLKRQNRRAMILEAAEEERVSNSFKSAQMLKMQDLKNRMNKKEGD